MAAAAGLGLCALAAALAPGQPKRPSKVYRLSDSVSVEAFAPTLVDRSTRKGEFVWYPKTLAWLGPGRLLLSHSTQIDGLATKAPIGVMGKVFTSGDNGSSFTPIERQPVYGVKPGLTHCQPAGTVRGAPHEARCMAGETSFWQPAGTANKPRSATVLTERFDSRSGRYLGAMNTSWEFADDIGGSERPTEFEMDMDGSVVPLANGALLASMYGPFTDGHLSNCSRLNASGKHADPGGHCSSLVVARSRDSGRSWQQIGVASDTPSKPEIGWPCL